MRLSSILKVVWKTKSVWMIAWFLISGCGTRMAHFLEACVVFSIFLVPLHDTLFSLNIRKERDTLFTAKNIYTLQATCDLHHFYHDKRIPTSRPIKSTCLNRVQNCSGKSQWNAWTGNTCCSKILKSGNWWKQQHNSCYWIEWQQT